MNNQNNTPNTTQANTNQYDLNIENSRTLNAQTGTNINQNPYINQTSDYADSFFPFLRILIHFHAVLTTHLKNLPIYFY